MPSYLQSHNNYFEALSRLRPVLIFDIDHIIGKHNIFVSDRNDVSLVLFSTYKRKLQDHSRRYYKTNVLPTNEKFINDIKSIILSH